MRLIPYDPDRTALDYVWGTLGVTLGVSALVAVILIFWWLIYEMVTGWNPWA